MRVAGARPAALHLWVAVGDEEDLKRGGGGGAASEEASKDVWVCVHTHPCLDYEDDDKVPHAEDSW